MRRRLFVPAAVLVVALPLGLVLASCDTPGGTDTGGASTSAANSDTEAGTEGPFPAVTGDFGEKPALAFPDAEPSATLQASVLSPGSGAVVEPGDLLVADYLGQVWDGAVFDSSFDRGSPSAFEIGTGNVIAGWDAGLAGQAVGSRVLLTIPPDLGYGAEGNPGAGIEGTDTIVFVVDLLASYGADAAGAADAVPSVDVPVASWVTGDLGAPASVAVPAGTPEPTEVTGTVLATADGPPVAAGNVIVHYAATYWDNSTRESTWEQGTPTSVTAGTGGVFDALLGVPVGSRVLVQVPAGEATPSIAVVVDVLDQLS